MDALIVFRHGQTEHNRTRRFQGQLDVPLNEVGRAQAARTGDLVASCLRSFFTLGGLTLECVTSDLVRARETATVVTGIVNETLAVPCFFREEPALREWDCGRLQDFTVDEFERNNPGVLPAFYASYEKEPWSTAYPGGESQSDVAKRLEPMLGQCDKDLDLKARARTTEDTLWLRQARHAGIVSSHGGVIHVLLHSLRCPLVESEQIIGNGDVLVLVPHASGAQGQWHVFRHYRVGDNVAAKIRPV